MHDPDITYGFLLRSPETWAFKSLPCSMSLWWPWTLCFSPYSPGCDSDFRPHRARWQQEHEAPAAVVRFSGGWYSLEQRAMSSPQSFLRPSHPRAPELEQRFQWSDTGLPRASVPGGFSHSHWGETLMLAPLCMEQLLLWTTADRPVLSQGAQLELHPTSVLQRK